jgi:translation initiation factor IF-2
MVESMGGDVMHVNISARTGMNIDELEKAVPTPRQEILNNP